MMDKYLVCIAGLIAFTYFIYMSIGPGGDGIIFATVVGALCAIAGVKYEKFKQTGYITPYLEASDDEPSSCDELQQ